MAYDKVVDSTVLENGLTQIADAIREKGELGDLFSAPLTFPSGFVSAVEGLSSGGATEPYVEETYDVNGHLTAAVMHGHTSIRSHAFHYCSTLVSVTLPDSVTKIMDDAFYICSNLTSIALPDGITILAAGAFQLCTKLELTALPASIIKIYNYAFDGCSKLALTTLPANVTDIGFRAFAKCSGLTTITFQGTPTSIDSAAFKDCSNLTTINVPWAEGAVANAPWGATNATIHYNVSGV